MAIELGGEQVIEPVRNLAEALQGASEGFIVRWENGENRNRRDDVVPVEDMHVAGACIDLVQIRVQFGCRLDPGDQRRKRRTETGLSSRLIKTDTLPKRMPMSAS